MSNAHAKTSLDEFPGSNGNGHDPRATDFQETLQQIRTAGSVNMSAELFEKLYISPAHPVKGDLSKTFANPTPIALVGFLIALTPLSCELMGWRGASGNGAAGIATYYFFGGMLQVLGGFLEFILGNAFPCVVFLTFGAFFFSFGGTMTPWFNTMAPYAPEGEPASAGQHTTGFTASFAFFMLFMGLMCVVFLICSMRTNICFVFIFFTLVLAFIFLTAAYFLLAQGKTEKAGKFVVAAGASCFVTSAFGWWVFAAIMFAIMDLRISLPVGDLSQVIKGASTLKKHAQD